MISINNRAVMIAFSCRPKSGSEWGVGWNYLTMLSGSFNHVTILIRNAENQFSMITKELEKHNIINIEVIPVDDMFFYSLFKTPFIHSRFLTLYYFFWLFKVFFILLFKRAWRNHDWVFHITWVSDWIFSPFFIFDSDNLACTRRLYTKIFFGRKNISN